MRVNTGSSSAHHPGRRDRPIALLSFLRCQSILYLLLFAFFQSLAAAYADRVALMKSGRIVATGTPTEVLTDDLLSEIYDHPVEIIAHPRTGQAVIVPRRE